MVIIKGGYIMNREEAKEAMFALMREYMSHNAKEKKKLYPKYREERNKINEALARTIVEEKTRIR